MNYGLLALPRLRRKPRRLMFELERAGHTAQVQVRSFPAYRKCKTLVLYGWGGEEQQRAIRLHNGNYVGLASDY